MTQSKNLNSNEVFKKDECENFAQIWQFLKIKLDSSSSEIKFKANFFKINKKHFQK